MREIKVEYNLKTNEVLDALSELLLYEVVPEYIRSDNGSEFTAKKIQDWLRKLDIKTAYLTPGSPWENGCNERFTAH